jgi:Zn-dependent M28 family amino/carboxypeptidase
VLGPKRQASRPVFYVRKGVLPATDKDKEPPTWTATWSTAAPEAAELPQYNVMGLLRGASKKDEFVIVSAHYDHIGTGRAVGGDAINNGADDNATGTTGVLLLAEALMKLPAPKRSILFVCFTGEERGLLGSKAFCARPPVPLDKVAVVLNLEMLGRPEPGKQGKAWFTGVDFSDLAAIAAPVLQRGGVEVVEFADAKALFQQSDNYPFALAGVVAHSLSAGSLHADYHQPSDQVDKLDIPHMTTVIRGLLELVSDQANRETPPQWSDTGREFLAKRRPKAADKPANGPK